MCARVCVFISVHMHAHASKFVYAFMESWGRDSASNDPQGPISLKSVVYSTPYLGPILNVL